MNIIEKAIQSGSSLAVKNALIATMSQYDFKYTEDENKLTEAYSTRASRKEIIALMRELSTLTDESMVIFQCKKIGKRIGIGFHREQSFRLPVYNFSLSPSY